MNLSEFLLARIAEDEEWVQAAEPVRPSPEVILEMLAADLLPSWAIGPPGASPGHLRRECDAKRRIVGFHRDCDGQCCTCDRARWVAGAGGTGQQEAAPERFPCPTLRALALPYADHAEYCPLWHLP